MILIQFDHADHQNIVPNKNLTLLRKEKNLKMTKLIKFEEYSVRSSFETNGKKVKVIQKEIV